MVEFLHGEPLVDRSLIDAFEKQAGVRLPIKYIEIALQHDGAYLEPSTCIYVNPTTGLKEAIACSTLIPFQGQAGDWTIDKANSGNVDGLPAGIVAFGEDGSGIMFGFDYRASPTEPPIVLLNFENLDEHVATRVADSFQLFLNSLVPDPGTANIP